ncbi:MAG TPA: hypothetical protein VE439_02735 [Anaerolineae bacterium]|jgi:hypothetical protein|nr:hypothetical protein [Anaerolineae bacterium]
MAAGDRNQTVANKRALGKKLEAVGWGLFFIWVGIALIANIGWGVGLLGAGIIILGVQVARYLFGLNWEGFSVAVGLLFALGGIWEPFNIQFSIVPILAIVGGIILLIFAPFGASRD